jgi:hypothetical protein
MSKITGPSWLRMVPPQLAVRGDPRGGDVGLRRLGQVEGAEQSTGRDIPDRGASAIIRSDDEIPCQPGPGAVDRIRPVGAFSREADGAIGGFDELQATIDLADDDRAWRRPHGRRAGVESLGEDRADATPSGHVQQHDTAVFAEGGECRPVS